MTSAALTSQTAVAAGRSDRAILDERARRLARPVVEEPDASDFVEVLTFALGEERFAIETQFVQEVVRIREPALLPGRSDALLGISNLRGAVLAVMDPRGALGVERGRAEPDWLVVVGRDTVEFGIAVDAVREVVSLRNEHLHAPSATSSIVSTKLVMGVTCDGVVVLEGERLLACAAFTIEDADV